MKIGILTFHRAYNYGAILQAFALQKKLLSLGYDSEIIDYLSVKKQKQTKLFSYKTNMSEALDGEDNDKFFRLLSSASVAMTDNEDCTRLMELYDGIDEDKLPPSRRVDFYGTAEGYCVSCGDNARQALYETKAQQLYDSGEVEDYEN